MGEWQTRAQVSTLLLSECGTHQLLHQGFSGCKTPEVYPMESRPYLSWILRTPLEVACHRLSQLTLPHNMLADHFCDGPVSRVVPGETAL